MSSGKSIQFPAHAASSVRISLWRENPPPHALSVAWQEESLSYKGSHMRHPLSGMRLLTQKLGLPFPQLIEVFVGFILGVSSCTAPESGFPKR